MKVKLQFVKNVCIFAWPTLGLDLYKTISIEYFNIFWLKQNDPGINMFSGCEDFAFSIWCYQANSS